ncbi:hypothetical protein [Saccharibacillus qingshengii]|uniref:hypothetical protein n=1 Tax=Saccharibacillus qingshengii TaxID=1763540 RepID=UPI001553D50F|nr:hypothetical protein [Saccharibacillus qingshengii]
MQIAGVMRMSVFLGIPDTTLYSIMKRNEDFPAKKTAQGEWLFDTQAVQKWWNDQYGVMNKLRQGEALSAAKLARLAKVRSSLVTRWVIEGMPHERTRSNMLAIDPQLAADWLIASGDKRELYGMKILENLSFESTPS